jgi:hypothetical protein
MARHFLLNTVSSTRLGSHYSLYKILCTSKGMPDTCIKTAPWMVLDDPGTALRSRNTYSTKSLRNIQKYTEVLKNTVVALSRQNFAIR